MRDMEGKEVDRRSCYERLGMDFGELWELEREVKFWEWDCISAPGLLGVLGTGAKISVDIMELGSYLVGREELGFG